MALNHGMHKETKPTVIKKNKHVNEKQRMDDCSRRKKSFSHGIQTQNMNAHMMIISS